MGGNIKIASHLPILEFLYSLKSFDNVLEFGCGNHSSNFFANHSKRVTSIEMSNEGWFQKIKDSIRAENFNIMYLPGDETIKWLVDNNEKYDLIFVDGIKRKECINLCFNRSPVILVHDTGTRAIRRGFLQDIIKNDYKFGYMGGGSIHPSTSMWIKDDELMSSVQKHEYFCRVTDVKGYK
jgi:hypothetical protein